MRLCKLLIVEDEPLVRLDLQMALQGSGHEVVGHASRLDEALMVARTVDCDVALLDLNIGGVRIDPIADLLIERGVKVVFITGYRIDDIAERHRHLPYIGKPFNLEALNSIVRQQCSRSSAAQCGPAVH